MRPTSDWLGRLSTPYKPISFIKPAHSTGVYVLTRKQYARTLTRFRLGTPPKITGMCVACTADRFGACVVMPIAV